MLAVTFIGYWAYGASTETYLLNSVNGPLWVKAAANITAFLQTIIALHVKTLFPVSTIPLLRKFFILKIKQNSHLKLIDQ